MDAYGYGCERNCMQWYGPPPHNPAHLLLGPRSPLHIPGLGPDHAHRLLVWARMTLPLPWAWTPDLPLPVFRTPSALLFCCAFPICLSGVAAQIPSKKAIPTPTPNLTPTKDAYFGQEESSCELGSQWSQVDSKMNPQRQHSAEQILHVMIWIANG